MGPGLETNAKQRANSHGGGECRASVLPGTDRRSSLPAVPADGGGASPVSRMRETIERRRVRPKAEDKP